MHKLLIEDDEGKTVAVPLIRDEITIGRVEGNTIRLTEQNVSRKHARLTLRDSVLSLEDLGSYNGTSLNGSALSGVATLKDGDVILIGDYRLGIVEEKTAQAEPAPPVQVQPVETPPAAAPTVQDALEGQPTIPISTMAVQAALTELPARLVIVSRFMSGTEFILDRPSQVLGRTPENDIIVNHKSISRHHAKIVREGDRYIILDLESANGVRVGGVEEDRVELQSGDVIELGEVRLRFLTGDSALDDEPLAWYQNKRNLATVAGVVVLGVGGLLYLAFSGGTGRKVAVPPPPSTPAVAPVVQPTPPPAPPVQEPMPAEPAVPMAELLADAKKSAQAEKWEEALALVGKALAQEPGSTDAADLRKAIEAERQYSEKLAALDAAFANKEFDTVIQGASEIPGESMYKPRAVELSKKAQGQFIATHLAMASAKLAAKDCDEARREAELVLGLEGKNKKAAAVVKRCEAMAAMAAKAESEPVVAAAKPAPRRPPPAPAATRPAAPRPVAAKPAEASKSESTPVADADKLIKDAQQAWFRGQYGVAIDAARKALRVKPNLANAYQIIAVCSCALHDADSAAKAYERLDERNKLYVKSSCQKNGIGF
jgi:pSer/pThr/pTyr-binding forkhead associated (FHA) protein/tetratricopeptide (TPR) repeat protein